MVELDRSVWICNTLNDLCNKVCVPNKSENLNLSVFNMITEKNESKTLRKHISCKCRCKFDGRKCNSDQWWNSNKRQCECKKCQVCEKDYIWNASTCSCETGEYLLSIMDDSVSHTYDEPSNCNENKQFVKPEISIFHLRFSYLL